MSAIWDFLVMYPDKADPRTNDWILMSSPWPTIIIVTLYLKFVNDWGPKWMKNRAPFRIDRIVQIYDISQIIANAYIFYQALRLAWFNNYSWRCEPIDYSLDPQAVKIARMVHLYYIVKVVDLLDTVFFVLRKKQNQVTFLHIWHHAIMVLATWVGTRFFAGGHGTFMGMVNSFVHAVMYAHYFVMSLKLCEPWWKKYLTQLQLIQFALVFYHCIQLWWVEDCGYPKWLLSFLIPQNLMFVYMFTNFYIQSYLKPAKRASRDETSKTKSRKSRD